MSKKESVIQCPLEITDEDPCFLVGQLLKEMFEALDSGASFLTPTQLSAGAQRNWGDSARVPGLIFFADRGGVGLSSALHLSAASAAFFDSFGPRVHNDYIRRAMFTPVSFVTLLRFVADEANRQLLVKVRESLEDPLWSLTKVTYPNAFTINGSSGEFIRSKVQPPKSLWFHFQSDEVDDEPTNEDGVAEKVLAIRIGTPEF